MSQTRLPKRASIADPSLSPSGIRPARLVVLVSGEGTNLQALVDGIASEALPAKVVLVLSSKPGVGALARAAKARIPHAARPYVRDRSLPAASCRAAYDAALADEVAGWEPDFVFLLGWMRILGEAFVSHFPRRVVNLHPALPGTFPGLGAIERSYDAWLDGRVSRAGVMTHLVPDAGVDSGPLIDLEYVDLVPGSSLEAFETDMHEAEHRLVLRTLRHLLAERSAMRGE